jgi:hypothetical protein
MKSFSALVAAAALVAKVSAHYTWPSLIVGGVNTTVWEYVRQTNNWQDLNPVTDVTSTDLRCYDSLESGTASTTTVAAGSTVGFTVVGNPSNLYHDGVVNVYMAKAPTGTDVASWDGSGDVWFKIFQIPAIADGVTITFPATGMTQVTFPIPASLPSGQYLIRTEHIALHVASTFAGAQFYISCAQVTVTNGGTGTPGPLVSIPGVYTGEEPGILIDIYWPIPTTYVQPGPAVWPATGGSAPASTSPVATTTVATTTAPATTAPKTTSVPGATTTVASAPPSSTSAAAEFAQCGGSPWTGPTTCVAPFTCHFVNTFYSQCL